MTDIKAAQCSLLRKATHEEIQELLARRNGFGVHPSVLKYVCKDLDEFFGAMRVADTIWCFNDIGDLAGSAGFAVVRNGKVVAVYTTLRS